MRKFKLENEQMGLNPLDFDNIQDLFSTLNSLRLQLSNCGEIKEDEKLIISILAKLGHDYLVFVSTFCAAMDALGNA
jgi:hypothetical protein